MNRWEVLRKHVQDRIDYLRGQTIGTGDGNNWDSGRFCGEMAALEDFVFQMDSLDKDNQVGGK